MWASNAKKAKQSDFYTGKNIISYLKNNVFGKIVETLSGIFEDEEMKELKLPKVIVIGNESTGKSSLLENISFEFSI